MKENMDNKGISKMIFLAGLLIFLACLFFPEKILSTYPDIKPLGMATIFILPLLGIGGIIFAIRERSILFAILNVLLVLSFPLTMFFGYLFL